MTAEEVSGEVAAVLELLRDRLPDTRLLILGARPPPACFAPLRQLPLPFRTALAPTLLRIVLRSSRPGRCVLPPRFNPQASFRGRSGRGTRQRTRTAPS